MNQNTPPEELTGDLEIGKPYTEAAGIPAVVKSFEHVLHGTGLARGWKALVNLNQKDGFDCPPAPGPTPMVIGPALPNIAKVAPKRLPMR
jgi:hypothetical protein